MLTEWSTAVVTELDSRVAQARQTAQAEQRRLADARETTARDALTRRRALEEELHELSHLRLRAATLSEAAAGLYREDGPDGPDVPKDDPAPAPAPSPSPEPGGDVG